MRRYIFDKKLYDNKNDGMSCYDVVIIGGGMAGLYTALMLDEKLSVAVVIKGNLEGGSSWLAQGGICCVLGDDDCFEYHIEDTYIAGAKHGDKEAISVLVREAPENIKKLIEFGVPFDRNPDGTLHITREGGHCRNRIIHCGGDATGREITKTLGNIAKTRKNIEILWNTNLTDILTEDGTVTGVVVNDGRCDRIIASGNVVIATGGAGQLYKYSTTPVGNTGEGISACVRAGCAARDMEFVQFHPTCLALGNNEGRVFLISEAVRGEGAVLKNRYGERFMKFHYQHPQAELAPRDIVTRAILEEMKRTNDTHVYLDTGNMTKEFFEKRFPSITEMCGKNGIYPPKSLIPVCPTQHYMMGGIVTDLEAKASVEGLYVCGEAASTGVHGANRLASNSTLECLVFGRRAADSINRSTRKIPQTVDLGKAPDYIPCPVDKIVKRDLKRIKEIMTENVGAVRRMEKLHEAYDELSQMLMTYEDCNFTNIEQYNLFSAISTSLMIVEAAINRKESLGSHYLQEEGNGVLL